MPPITYMIFCPNYGNRIGDITNGSTVKCKCGWTITLTETSDGYITLKVK